MQVGIVGVAAAAAAATRNPACLSKRAQRNVNTPDYIVRNTPSNISDLSYVLLKF